MAQTSRCRAHRQGHAATLLAVMRERNPPNNSIMRQASMLPIRALNHEGQMIEPGGPLAGEARQAPAGRYAMLAM
jgi:hypothetical protein